MDGISVWEWHTVDQCLEGRHLILADDWLCSNLIDWLIECARALRVKSILKPAQCDILFCSNTSVPTSYWMNTSDEADFVNYFWQHWMSFKWKHILLSRLDSSCFSLISLYPLFNHYPERKYFCQWLFWPFLDVRLKWNLSWHLLSHLHN